MASSTPTPLSLPPHLPYPLSVLSLHAGPGDTVARGDRLLTYSFAANAPGAPPDIRFGTWDSPLDGVLARWNISERDIVSARRAHGTPALLVQEQCKHEVQMGGLCAICGKDMTSFDYTGFSDASRASIQMTHSANGPTVSLEEARRIDRESAQHLLNSRRLSLIVDLDQTIVHATVDPTVGEWIAEGEAWEARRAKRIAAAKRSPADGDPGPDPDPDPDPDPEPDGDGGGDDDDDVNPNWEALKDVKKFRLGPESFAALPGRNPRFLPKEKAIENQGCLYYVKPRPGWQEFLTSTATKYEMHVYTMGTRAYAEEVCAAIDPDGKYFGGRLLSRDESGSMTQKSLHRLFPVDTSMVVIIDDRADVWEWSPNLVKVIPYDFFVGIGDINSAFLPKIDPFSAVVPSDRAPPPAPSSPTLSDASSDTLVSSSSQDDPGVSTLEAEEKAEALNKTMITQNSLALEAQVEQRPLARKQEELQESASDEPAPEQPSAAAAAAAVRTEKEAPPKEKHARKALLRNDDVELERVAKLLDEVHKRFFDAYDRRPPDSHHVKNYAHAHAPGATLRLNRSADIYDATRIIPRMRMETFKGVHIVFSSVIPLDTRPETTEIWRMARAFGATCHTELSSKVTHVVAAKRGTVKVDTARKRGICVVWVAWFTDSVARWARQDEAPYLMADPPRRARTGAGAGGGGDEQQEQEQEQDQDQEGTDTASSSPVLEAQQISSDPEPDADDWDTEPGARGEEGGAAGAGARGDVKARGRVGVLAASGSGSASETGSEDGSEDGGGGGGAGSGGSAIQALLAAEMPSEASGEEARRLDEVDWALMSNEVDELMNESEDDEEGEGDEGEGAELDTDESNSVVSSATSTPRTKRKRVRSVTPSDGGGGGGVNGGADGGEEDDELRSPLAKRKKLVEERRNSSKLREAFSVDELHAREIEMDGAGGAGVQVGAGDGAGVGGLQAPVLGVVAEEEEEEEEVASGGKAEKEEEEEDEEDEDVDDDDDDDDDSDDSDDDDEEEDDDDDDFLARELQEELG